MYVCVVVGGDFSRVIGGPLLKTISHYLRPLRFKSGSGEQLINQILAKEIPLKTMRMILNAASVDIPEPLTKTFFARRFVRAVLDKELVV